METKLLPGITVFTPTYNRAHTLRRLYDSLLEQTGSFEWVVVDDGSTDDTGVLVASFMAQDRIPIRYIYKENGGKHTALNEGIRQAGREYFLCLDSDDCLASGAIEALSACVDRNTPEGIIAYKTMMDTDQRIGPEFPAGLESCTLFRLINDYSCAGDRTLVYRTELLRQNLIPEPQGVKFFPETYLYDRFDETHSCVLLRRSICRCEYQQGGYSDSFRMLMIRNAVAMKWFYAARIDMPCRFRVRYGNLYRYVAFSLLAPGKTGKYRGKNRHLLILGVPMGLAMFAVYAYYRICDKRKRKSEK